MRYHKANGEEVIVYTNEERERALNVSLTSLAVSLGFTPIRQGAHYSLKEMDSLVIYNDRSWNRWSGRGDITSGSQIDFLLAFGGVNSVPEAIQQLLEFQGEHVKDIYVEDTNAERRERSFALPPKNANYKRLFAYLIKTRGLSQEVVSDFVHRNLIYEDSVHHNIVYCGYDPEGNIRYAGLRGTADIYGKKFKMDVLGNDKNYGVNIVNSASDELKVFESVIDCMSYIDMYGDTKSNKLILGMVEDNPLVQFLKDYSHIRKISFCLDSDAAAQKAIYGDATKKQTKPGLKEKYEERGYIVTVEVPPYGKDFNESLIESKKFKPACIEAMKIRGYEHIGDVGGKIAFKRVNDAENHGDTAGWIFQYNSWHEVREALVKPPLWESKEITEQVDQLIQITTDEKKRRISEAQIQSYLSGMADLGYTRLLDYQKGDLTALTFLNPDTGETLGIDGWELVGSYLEERSLFQEDGALKSEYNEMLQLIKEYESKVPLAPSECVINYMTGELDYGIHKSEFMAAYEKAEKWRNETEHSTESDLARKTPRRIGR